MSCCTPFGMFGSHLRFENSLAFRSELRFRQPQSSGDTGSGLGMPRASQHCTNITPTTLLNLDHSLSWGPELQPQAIIRVRVWKTSKPTSPGTVDLQKACQEEHGTAPTLLFPQIFKLDHPLWWEPYAQHQAIIRVEMRAQRTT